MESQSRPIRWGFIGCGHVTFDFITAMRLLPETEHKVTAIAGLSYEEGAKFNKTLNGFIPKVYNSHQELADDPDIDVVHVANVNSYHFGTAMMMMEAGKNVLCEKPMTLNYKLARQLITESQRKQLFLMEGFWCRFFPIYDDLRYELAAKSLGRIHTVIINMGIDFARFDIGRMITGIGRGAMNDIGCYAVMLATLVYDERPERVHASGILTDSGDDRCETVTLYYSGKRRALLNIAKDVKYDNRATIYGENGNIEIDRFYKPERMKTPEMMYERPVPWTQVDGCRPNKPGFRFEIAAVGDCIRKGLTEHPLMTHEHTLIITEIRDEVRRQIGVVYKED